MTKRNRPNIAKPRTLAASKTDIQFQMKNLHDASYDLMNHVVFALNHSMDLKRDGVDPMTPFAIAVNGTEKTIKVFAGDTLEYADNRYERTILDEKPDFVVYACDTYLTTDGIKYDAVLFKAYDKRDSEIYLIGQKYRVKTDQVEFEQIGNPDFLGTEINKFYGQINADKTKGNTSNKSWWKFW